MFVSVICLAVYQTELAGAVIAPAICEHGQDREDNGQADQNAEQWEIAELGERGESFGDLADERTAHEFEPVGDWHGEPDGTQPCRQNLEREDRAAAKTARPPAPRR